MTKVLTNSHSFIAIQRFGLPSNVSEWVFGKTAHYATKHHAEREE